MKPANFVNVVDIIPRDRYPGFLCDKSLSPIHYPSRWHRDGLLIYGFESAVTAMSPADPGHLPECADFGFAIEHDIYGRSLVALYDRCVPRRSETVGLIQISRAAILQSPNLGLLRRIWRYKRSQIDLADWQRICTRLSATSGEAPLIELLPQCHSDRLVPTQQIFGLIANGILTADLTGRAANFTVSFGKGSREHNEDIAPDRIRPWDDNGASPARCEALESKKNKNIIGEQKVSEATGFPAEST